MGCEFLPFYFLYPPFIAGRGDEVEPPLFTGALCCGLGEKFGCLTGAG